MGTKRKAAPSGNGNPMCLSQDKDKQILGQYQTTYLAFHSSPKTMLQVSNETGIRRANICRYVAKIKQVFFGSFLVIFIVIWLAQYCVFRIKINRIKAKVSQHDYSLTNVWLRYILTSRYRCFSLVSIL